MRSSLARFALVGMIGVALAGCSSSGGVSGLPNGAGGGTTTVTPPTAPGGTIASVLIDGGVYSFQVAPLPSDAYAAFNMSAQTFEDTGYCQPSTPPSDCPVPDAGQDTQTSRSAKPPYNPPGWQDLTFQGSGQPQDIFQYLETLPSLVYSVAPAHLTLQTYGAIVLFANYTPGPLTGQALAGPGVAVELTGGSGAATFDVRVACSAGSGAISAYTATPPWTRFVCDLPTYASASGSYTTKYAAPTGTATVGTFSLASSGPAIQNPVIANAAGQFTPTAATMYIVLTPKDGLQPFQTGNQFGIDYVYAEQGTQ